MLRDRDDFFFYQESALSIWTYFVRKIFQDCLNLFFVVQYIMPYVAIVLHLLALLESFHRPGAA